MSDPWKFPKNYVFYSTTKSIVATLKESSVESHAASEPPSDAQTWSEVVRRKSRPSGKKGEMGRQAKGGSEQAGAL